MESSKNCGRGRSADSNRMLKAHECLPSSQIPSAAPKTIKASLLLLFQTLQQLWIITTQQAKDEALVSRAIRSITTSQFWRFHRILVPCYPKFHGHRETLIHLNGSRNLPRESVTPRHWLQALPAPLKSPASRVHHRLALVSLAALEPTQRTRPILKKDRSQTGPRHRIKIT